MENNSVIIKVIFNKKRKVKKKKNGNKEKQLWTAVEI